MKAFDPQVWMLPLGTYHVPHGLAVGIMTPHVMDFNLAACERQIAQMAIAIGVATDDMTRAEMAGSAVDAVKGLYDVLEFPDRLKENMASKEKIPTMVENAMKGPHVRSNLRKSGPEDLVKIYEAAYQGWR